MSMPSPTTEQQRILADMQESPNAVRKVSAFAGSGKTSTLRMLSDRRQDRGMYLAFNTSIRDEAKSKFPGHIKVMTAHAQAFRAQNMFDQQARLQGRIFPDKVGELVDVPKCGIPPDAVGYMVLETVARFCNSKDQGISRQHVALSPGDSDAVIDAALKGARLLWARMSNPNDTVPMTHDTYLKMWQLGDARIPGVSWAMFDECQDASPVMIDVMMRQGIPITWIGDPHQSIYAWRGAVNAMDLVPGKPFPLTMSFRFGERVAEMANWVLACKPEAERPTDAIKGFPGRASEVGMLPSGIRHAFLSRTNSEWLSEALRHKGSVHVIGGIKDTSQLLLSASELWRHGTRSKLPSLSRFATWQDMCEYADKFRDRELILARRVVEQYRESLPSAVRDLERRHVPNEADASLVCSTAHKAKGREFDMVRLGEGFISPLDDEWNSMSNQERSQELNLLYVAATRAVEGLQPNRALQECKALATGAAPKGVPPPSQPLPLILSGKVPSLPVMDQSIGLTLPMPPPIPLPVVPRSSPLASETPPARSVMVAKPWTRQDDLDMKEMQDNGFTPEQMAEFNGFHLLVVRMRLLVQEAAGDTELLHMLRQAASVPPPFEPKIPSFLSRFQR